MSGERIRTELQLHPWDEPNLFDRAVNRDPQAIAAAWRQPGTRIIELDADGRFWPQPLGVPTQGPLDEEAAYLGRAGQRHWFVRRSTPISVGSTIREAELDGLQRQLLMAGLAVLNWIERSRYCARCGTRLRRTRGGFAAQCPGCGLEHFPRTDPAVIVAVLDHQDRIFLAHQGAWGTNRASLLAGFVESGESAENALFRELAEEAALQIDAFRYLGSQPWPFPRSLMLAYVARSGSVGRVDGIELEWGGWYSRTELASAEASGELVLPGHGSIARRVVDAWRAGGLPSPE